MGNFDVLPEEMRLEILTRLPTQSVLECKLVSRSWRGIVHHPSFSKKHLNHLNDSDSASGKLSFILFHKIPGLAEEYTEYDDESSSHDTPPFSKTRSFNLISPFRHYEILDSCNGLICFNALRNDYSSFAWNAAGQCRTDYYGPSFICNPVTRECVILPKFEGKDMLTGFGYSSSTNEYKVVGIRGGIVQVYTLGSGNGWRNAGKMDYKMTAEVRRGVSANGALHWVDKGGTVVAFDLANEKLSVIPSPPIPRPDYFDSLVVLGDRLCANYVSGNHGILILKLNKDNHGMTWNRELSLELHMPIVSTKSGRLLCYGSISGNVYRHDPKASSTELIESFGRSVCLFAPHKNTLISLKALGEKDTQRMKSVERATSSQVLKAFAVISL